MEPEHDGGNVDVLMYAHSDDEHEDTSQWEAFPVPFTTSPQSFPSPLQPPHTYRLRSSVQKCEFSISSIVSSIRRVNKILGVRIGYLNRLLIFKVLDGEQDDNVFPVLCQRDVWGCANPTSTRITSEW